MTASDYRALKGFITGERGDHREQLVSPARIAFSIVTSFARSDDKSFRASRVNSSVIG
ncbi:MAG TPA: hypothetical protein VG994_18610 [Steroidobacteraceae bacterium]|nr:hypothetical protein [Steroidobacteraceae bacterium]